MDNKGKEGGFTLVFLVLAGSLVIAGLWEQLPIVREIAHRILDPTAGYLLDWHITYGMLAIVLLISIFTTVVQKYATDQESLRELRKEQKILQDEMKEFKDHPEKLLALQKKQMQQIPENFMKTFKLTSRAMVFTTVPFILLFRWFNDYFTLNTGIKFFGILNWFWFYFIFVILFSSVLRKKFNVV